MRKGVLPYPQLNKIFILFNLVWTRETSLLFKDTLGVGLLHLVTSGKARFIFYDKPPSGGLSRCKPHEYFPQCCNGSHDQSELQRQFRIHVRVGFSARWLEKFSCVAVDFVHIVTSCVFGYVRVFTLVVCGVVGFFSSLRPWLSLCAFCPSLSDTRP